MKIKGGAFGALAIRAALVVGGHGCAAPEPPDPGTRAATVDTGRPA